MGKEKKEKRDTVCLLPLPNCLIRFWLRLYLYGRNLYAINFEWQSRWIGNFSAPKIKRWNAGAHLCRRRYMLVFVYIVKLQYACAGLLKILHHDFCFARGRKLVEGWGEKTMFRFGSCIASQQISEISRGKMACKFECLSFRIHPEWMTKIGGLFAQRAYNLLNEISTRIMVHTTHGHNF